MSPQNPDCHQGHHKAIDATGTKVPLGDPFILLWNGKYYAYGTGVNSDQGIAVFVSDDLLTWQGPVGATNGLALDKADVWADRWFWAPEVYHVNGKFYMYYTADEHICVATSASSLGPFKQDVQEPMTAGEKSIDASPFIDDDGRAYFFFVKFNDGNNIWGAELQSDLLHIKPDTMRKAMNVSQDWETVKGRVNEGPSVFKHNGTYYMTYSANDYQSQSYGVGYATAKHPLSTWTKYADNPILQKPSGLVGTGHSALFTDKEGKLRIVFHAHNGTTAVQPRNMYIGTVVFTNGNGKEVMGIDKTYITPVLAAPRQQEAPRRKKTGARGVEVETGRALSELRRAERLVGDPKLEDETFQAISAEYW
ncbi:MAG: glycoside hydrolase family 43 protein [Elusimicrobia bacterium]|nr:glycoside hydrolase family 43 protein [Elusimicrobiota bacterium]